MSIYKARITPTKATTDVAYTTGGVKHKLIASGIERKGTETTYYWNSKDKLLIETTIESNTNPVEKLDALKRFVDAAHASKIARYGIKS
jgi:DNA-binding transcriptional regulator YbjK